MARTDTAFEEMTSEMKDFFLIFFKSISFAFAPYLLVNQSLMYMLLIHNKNGNSRILRREKISHKKE